MKNKKIDIVIAWVDGSDSEWSKKRSIYDKNWKPGISDVRFRDWGLLKYLLRGIEKFAPWTNHIYLITDNQRPDWLKETDRLTVVDHNNFMSQENLPVFSSHPIELNMFRIEGLSDNFIYFNDDTLLTKNVKITDFYDKNGKPKYRPILNGVSPLYDGGFMPNVVFNDTIIINKHFNFRNILKNNFLKFFCIRNGIKNLFRNIYNVPGKGFPGMLFSHLPTPFTKNTFLELWEKEYQTLENTSKSRFRSASDVNQYLFIMWEIAKGSFSPIYSKKYGKAFFLTDKTDDVVKSIKYQKYKMVCINDSDNISDFEKTKKDILSSFDSILPERSSFEK